ncbi:unnamed protein product [Urochloa decumbens]|uniref:Pentatricopeptide repeat-containing protein n=1 Tax=Urochloa decumbens TaxID=240449 RepID=A0ABC8ZIL0_9POAL
MFSLHVLLQQCVRRRCLLIGKGCHALAIHLGLATDTITCNILINLYTKCGMNDCARHVFDAMTFKSIVSWNTMIAGYTCNGDDLQALKLFSKMHQEGAQMSEFTLSSTLSACAAKFAAIECKQLHTIAIKLALDSNSFVATAVLDVYAKCNMINDACLVFEKISEKTAVTWSTFFSGLVQNGLHEDALRLFQSSQREGVQLTEFTLSAILSTCASLALMTEGMQLHAVIFKYGFHGNFFVASSLVDVYARCGQIEQAYLIFAGLVEEARCYFSLLISDQIVEPNVLHYSCMVDVLGRSGKTDEALELIQLMPFEPTASMWGSLLGSCRKYRNVGLARLAAEELFKLEPENGGNHALLSNVYAASGSWEDAVLARKYLNDSGAKKDMGLSWINTKGKVHIFGCEQKEELFV